MTRVDWGWTVGAVVGGMVVVFMLTAYAAKPLKWIWLGILYTAVGAVALYLANWIGGQWGFHLPINPVTAFVTGVLGWPGLLCLVVIKVWVVGL